MTDLDMLEHRLAEAERRIAELIEKAADKKAVLAKLQDHENRIFGLERSDNWRTDVPIGGA